MIDEKTYKQYRRELSTAQWKYIFDRKYISFNPRTKESLVKKGFVFEFKDREIISKSKHGLRIYGTEFTKKTHDMVEYYANKTEQKILIDHPNAQFVRDDKKLLDIFSECILIGMKPEIYVYRGREAIIQGFDDDYILSPLYLWKIEMDKTYGKFLIHKSVVGHKGSYCLEYHT